MQARRLLVPLAAAVVSVALVGCHDGSTAPDAPAPPLFRNSHAATSDPAAAIAAGMDRANVALASAGLGYRVGVAEYVTGSGNEAGGTVVSKDVGNKQLEADFVPFDPRRAGTPTTNGGWSGSLDGPTDDITYAVDQTGDASIDGLTKAETTAAIDAAMGTWDRVQCSNIPITKNPDYGVDIGVLAYLNGLGGSPYVVADVQHAGWGDIDFPDGVLGVTYTFYWIDDNGNPTDIDNNGKLDVAFREIYYDPATDVGGSAWPWTTDGSGGIDVETVALHEAGHGLSQAHFGNIFIKNDGSVKAAPRAVMNPYIFGVQRTLLGSDVAGHCSIWSDWPNN